MMKWYYRIMGGHTHVRVFLNGKCGDLVFTNQEFETIREEARKNNERLMVIVEDK